MTSSPIPNAKAKFWNRAGQPLAGGKLYTYVAGSTNTNKATYKDYNNTATNTNPVILDAYGEADIWLDGIYKLYLTDANDVPQWSAPIDNVSSINTTNTTYTTTGSGNAYILTPSPAITSYVGSSFSIIPNFTNTAPATININGLGVINLRKNGSSALAANDLISGQFYTIAYDGTNFQVTNLNSNFTSLTVTGLTTLADVKIIDSINDTNNNEVIKIGATTSAVNEITITNAAAGGSPTFASTGDDDNIAQSFQVKGMEGYNFKGTSTIAANIRVFEQTTNGNNFVAISVPALAADSNFILPATTGANGDLLGGDGSGQLAYKKGNIIDRAYTEYTTYGDLNTVLPIDDTVPQVTEGTQILSASITPKSTTNRIRIRVQGFATNTASAPIAIAAFVNGGANAVAATFTDCDTSTIPNVMVGLEYEYVPGSTSAQTITIRAGSSSAGTRFNGNASTRLGGGTARTTLILEEITA